MKKVIFSIILYLFTANCFAQTSFISKVRTMYDKAATQERTCEKLLELLMPYNKNNNPLLLGYKASATMMMAGHVFNPFSKLSYFNKGKQMLEEAINADKNNAELRFLRLAAQTNAPSFLGYNDHMTIDKRFLKQALPQLADNEIKKFIISHLRNLHLLNSEKFSFKTVKP